MTGLTTVEGVQVFLKHPSPVYTISILLIAFQSMTPDQPQEMLRLV